MWVLALRKTVDNSDLFLVKRAVTLSWMEISSIGFRIKDPFRSRRTLRPVCSSLSFERFQIPEASTVSSGIALSFHQPLSSSLSVISSRS